MSETGKAIEEIRQNIKCAQARSPLAAEDVLLLAVTKTVEPQRIQEAITAGVTALGENKVQELLSKFDQLEKTVDWHLIGHLQTNKVKYIIDKVALIHSLDSIPLAEEIEKRAEKAGLIMPVLVQVNVADEDSKFGIAPGDTVSFIQELTRFAHLKVQGLMTIGPLVTDAETVRPVFRQLRGLRDRVQELKIPGIEMRYLSMGMTNDYQVAVEEGANIVRVGSAIFGRRTYLERGI